MSLLKCNCCGGDLNIKDGDKVVTCPYCGSQQTIPNEKDEQVLKIYARGNRLRSQGEFDKAYSTYSQLLNEGKENAEVYWNLLYRIVTMVTGFNPFQFGFFDSSGSRYGKYPNLDTLKQNATSAL